MQVFNVIWVRWLLVMVLGGLGLALALYLAFAPSFARPKKEELEQYPAGIQVGRRPIPAVLILVFVIVGCVMIGYLWEAWASGVGF
jgi:hypothetical protein